MEEFSTSRWMCSSAPENSLTHARQRLSAAKTMSIDISSITALMRLSFVGQGTVDIDRNSQPIVLEIPRNAMVFAYRTGEVQFHGDITARHHAVQTSQ